MIQETVKINILVEEVVENGKKYYIATSEDLQGFLAEGESFDELKQNAEEVINALLQIKAQRNREKLSKMKEKMFQIAYMFNSFHLQTTA